MKTFFFGPRDEASLGVFHPPEAEPRGVAALICHPFGQEYVRSHRSFRQLGLLLAREGVAALRFDYHGCGDSAGTEAEADLDRWVADTGRAAGELKVRAPGCKLLLVGLRLGGALAALHGARTGGAAAVALWDPVVSGRRYRADLIGEHLRYLETMTGRLLVRAPGPGEPGGNGEEALGFPLPARLAEQLDSLDLLSLPRPAPSVLLIQTEAQEGLDRLAAAWSAAGAAVRPVSIAAPAIWRQEGDALVPAEVLRAIVAWALERAR